MKPLRAITFLLLLHTVTALAQAPAKAPSPSSSMGDPGWAKAKLEKSPRHGEWVTIKHDNRSVQAFVVYPESKGKAPVVIVIQEIFGLTDWVRDVADQLAAN